MESVDIRVVSAEPCTGLQASMEPALCALSSRFEARGLSKSVLDSAAAQIKREEETRKLAPDAYRLSGMSEAMINGHYRKGKDTMSTSDVIRYFSETRSRRIRNLDFASMDGEAGISDTETDEYGVIEASDPAPTFPRQIKTVATTVGNKIAKAAPTWFNGEKADTSKETRRFPLSAFAALLAIAMSLMLIVASAIMVNRANNTVSQLRQELDTVKSEVSDLNASFQVQNDLREIYRIAVEEYGMVGEEYIRMEYLSLDGEESVEAFEEETKTNVSLDAILSALGIKK